MEKERDFDLTKIDSEFGVLTQDKDCHLVTQELGLTPDRYHQKGEKTYSKFSPNPGIRQSGLWAVSKVSVGEDPRLSEHIKHFQNLLEGKIKIIEKLKKKDGFEFVLYVSVTTEYGAGGFDLSEEELSFIKTICDRFTYSFVTVKEV